MHSQSRIPMDSRLDFASSLAQGVVVMPGSRRKKKSSRRLPVTMAAADPMPMGIPKRWVKLVVAAFLVVPCGLLTWTFFSVFADATIHQEFWNNEAFWFFTLGVILWLGVFFGLPRPMRVYVFGHELTHALWVKLQGGEVHDFRVRKDGGYILADRTSTWIALAPYFFPIYSILVLAIYGIAAIFTDVTPYHRWMLGLLGFTWAFHLTFTCLMIGKGQPDLHYGGTFFSMVIIITINVAILSGLLIVASPEITLWGFLREFLRNASELTVSTTIALNHWLR